MPPLIWWLRRDLRLRDNQALTSAISLADSHVYPVFILDPALLGSDYASSRRTAFLFGALRELDADLRQLGSRLIVRQGRPEQALADLCADTGADGVIAEEDVSPYARARDSRVAVRVPLQLVAGLTVHRSGDVVRQNGDAYTVYTPYRQAWRSRPLPGQADLLPAPERIDTPLDVASVPLPDQPHLDRECPFVPGEQEAQRRLQAFCAREIYRYADDRNRMDMAGTSGLSPYLRFGQISARQTFVSGLAAAAAAQTDRARRGVEAWLDELIWREFYKDILHHFPRVRRESFRLPLRDIRWANDREEFAAWCRGRTGYPIVDAAMRQLARTGWMHNRARMIVASFLTKDLLIDWRWGERWFMQQLVDGDPAANNGGWQWSAGTGTDAAPYFRVFNPTLQGMKFDPSGSYIRRWVAELETVPEVFIHTPWTMPPEIQQAAGCRIGQDYPAPMIDHRWARQRALNAYRAAGESRQLAESEHQ